MWVFIALIAGSLVVSQHDTEEACQGRKAMAERQKVTNAKCVELPVSTVTHWNGSGIVLTPNAR